MLQGALLVAMLVSGVAALSFPPAAARRILDLPPTPYRYSNAALPAHFMKPGQNHDNTPPDNRLSDDGATLGRVLFYDTRLSANNTTSCASCHVQAHAFADPKPFSRGFHGARTDRRAMPLVNLRYYERSRFFWDERAGNLEEMVLMPITSRIEMGQDLERLVGILRRDRMYPVLFARAFGDRQVTEERIGKALAQFVRSIVSYRSKYDEGRSRVRSAQDDFGNFTLQENRGKALFMRSCATCHMKDGNEHFLVQVPANTRLRGDDRVADGGVGDVTLSAADLGSFKSPSLRNVEVTAPYGHDGRFATLDALIDHYSENPVVDPNLGYVIPQPLEFTASEKAALVAFLKTLTDRTCLTDPRFSDPFVESKDDALTRVRRAEALLVTNGASPIQAALVLHSAMLDPGTPPLPPPPPEKSHDPVIERLESFDRNADHRISRHELPERMQGLIARVDRNGDAALDAFEIRDFVHGASSGRPTVPFRPQPSEGLAGVIEDLKLPSSKHDRALAIANAHRRPPHFNDSAERDLHAKMRAVLDDEEYGNFVAAAARLPGHFLGIR
jgi:cytochrome c peroxidase